MVTTLCIQLAREIAPGPSIVTDGEVREYIKENLGTTFRTFIGAD